MLGEIAPRLWLWLVRTSWMVLARQRNKHSQGKETSIGKEEKDPRNPVFGKRGFLWAKEEKSEGTQGFLKYLYFS